MSLISINGVSRNFVEKLRPRLCGSRLASDRLRREIADLRPYAGRLWDINAAQMSNETMTRRY